MHTRDLASRAQIDDFDRVIEARHHVQALPRLVQHEPGWPAAAELDLPRTIGDEGIGFELERVEDAHLARAHRGHVKRAAVAGYLKRRRQRQSRFALGVR
jgi:phage head maturation protease